MVPDGTFIQTKTRISVTQQLTLLQGDCREVLKTLPDQSVHCCVTSPPYYGLRDYGANGQIGLEQTPAEYVDQLVAVFREVKRVLREDGTCWLNLGDSYSRDLAKGGSGPNGKHDFIPDYGNARRHMSESKGSSDGLVGRGDRAAVRIGGLAQKQLLGIPWRIAFALQADGWWLRQDIIWAKPNPMPESVTDRCTKSHEYIFLLTKSPRYYYDQAAIKEQAKDSSVARLGQDVESQEGSDRVPGKTNGRMKAVKFGGNKQCPDTRLKSGNEWQPKGRGGKNAFRGQGHFRDGAGPANREGRDMKDVGASIMANKKSVWTVPTTGFDGAHFATFPPDLIKPCILAGCPAGGVVLDPFGGSGTTGMVALELGRRAILVELNPDYLKLCDERCRTTVGLAL